jgi:hypothetical protein
MLSAVLHFAVPLHHIPKTLHIIVGGKSALFKKERNTYDRLRLFLPGQVVSEPYDDGNDQRSIDRISCFVKCQQLYIDLYQEPLLKIDVFLGNKSTGPP